MARSEPRHRWRELGVFAGAVLLALTTANCDSEPLARAYRVEDRSQLVGGPSAIGEIEDYILENERLRAVILQGGNSVGPGMFGGTIVDVDLRRPDTANSAGRGEDQFAELFPMVNLVIPGYQDEQGYGIGDLDVRIWSDGDDDRCPLPEEEAPDGCAAIRVAGRGDNLIEALDTIGDLGVLMDLSFITYYILRPGDRYIMIRTYFWLDSVGGWDFTSDGFEMGADNEPEALQAVALRIDEDENDSYGPLTEEAPIFDALLGNSMTPPEEGQPYLHPGLLAGDFLLFGKSVTPFGTSSLDQGLWMDRSGFDLSYVFQRRYDRGEIVLERPLADTVVVGVGHRVSYGYLSGVGAVVVPILTGSFTGAFTHSYQCVTATGAEDCGDELARPLVYDRYFVVGDGDAASVLDVYYDLNDTPTGHISGHVLDELTGQPIEDARVFAILDPRTRTELLPDGFDPETAFQDYDTLSEIVRSLDLNQDEEGTPDDNPGIVSFAAVDGGIDRVPDGSYHMRLEEGDYLLVAYAPGREVSRPIPLSIDAGQEEEISFAIPHAGGLNYEIHDETGELTTAKLTLIGPLESSACPIDERDPSLISLLSSVRHLELGSSERPHGIAKVIYSETGQGHVDLAPGTYDVIASKGFEHSIDRRCITLRRDTTPQVQFSVLREVDTTGWVAGDFHVHGRNSFDGNMPHDLRIISAVAEGIEIFSTTDHDYITNLEPVVYDMNMRDELQTMVGIETTPIELGHILGYPLLFDETTVDNGAPDWTRREVCLFDPTAFGCPENPTGYLALTPDEIFQSLRELGEFGPEHTVVTVPHPRDGFFGYFDQYGLNQFDLVLDEAGMVRGKNPLLAPFPAGEPDSNMRFRLYSENFDAIELFNGARYEMIRTPTVGEVTRFAAELARAAEESASDEEFASRMVAIHDRAVRQVLLRTTNEQATLRYDRFIECFTHDDCEGESLCDPHRNVCIDNVLCSAEIPCEEGFNCESNIVRGANNSRCIEACTTDVDCRVDEYCRINDGNTFGRCTRAACNIAADGTPLPFDEAPESEDRPCIRNEAAHSEGVVDDWFRLLNYGVFYTGMGNSDTHTPSSEIGLPRNYVQSSTDAPPGIDRREIADNIRAGRVVASYGPFIEMTALDGTMGDTVSANGEVPLHVRVQSPSWFDVDRIEVYANGMLLCDIGYSSESPCNTTSELAWDEDSGENTSIVNFEGDIIVDPQIDTWYVVIAMGVSEQSRGLSPVYFAALHPNLGFTEVIGQAFASFDNPILSAVVPPPVARSEVNVMVPYAVTNPIWVESNHDDDDRWIPPLGVGDPDDLDNHGIPGYRRDIICQHVSDRSINPAGCRDQPLMPLSTESLGSSPFLSPEETAAELRAHRLNMIRNALMRLAGGGC